ncbi:MAG: dihydrolipoyl dehydrogenase [Bacteroidota bacterium]
MNYDVAVVGSGPGGYVCAIRCAQLGMKTALIEKEKTLGGTCLNVGCIPSKAMLDSSEHYHAAHARFEEHGIKLKDLQVDLAQMVRRKQAVVDQTVGGVEFLMKKNNIEVIRGHGSFKDANTITVDDNGQKSEVTADKIIIATGSVPITPPAFGFDGNRVITSTEALEITKLPKTMVIIGGGVIGLELGSVYARIGTEVTVIEYQDRILPGMDKDVAKELMRSMKKLGVTFKLGHMVTNVKGLKTAAKVEYKKRDTEDTQEIKADYCLIAIGRQAYTDGLELSNVGITSDERGRIEVDAHLRTAVPNIYAIGDVVKGDMLAHKAEEEGVVVAEQIAGQKPHIDYNLIPGVVYTWPEVSGVGKTEEQLKSSGIPIKVGKFPMRALGRSRASMDIEGMIKVISHAETDELLGVHMVGARAADLIMEAVALMEFRASAEDMARICHPHPTYSEAVKEAALAATGDRAIHV